MTDTAIDTGYTPTQFQSATRIMLTDPAPEPGALRASRQIDKLAGALATAQGQFKNPTKDKVAKVRSDKGSYEYRYADLADVIDAVRKPLAEAGLSYAQLMLPGPKGNVLLTRLMHASGQWMETEVPLPPYVKMQELGSHLTFLRRYVLTALLGVAADTDDDASAGDGVVAEIAPRQPKPTLVKTEPPKPVVREDRTTETPAAAPEGDTTATIMAAIDGAKTRTELRDAMLTHAEAIDAHPDRDKLREIANQRHKTLGR